MDVKYSQVRSALSTISTEKKEMFLKLVILFSAMILGNKNASIITSYILDKTNISCLFLAFSTRLFSVLRYESVIHEFDPYFNYRTTKYLVEEGFYNFHNWFDDRAWYPLGRIIGGTIYPGRLLFYNK